MKMTAPLFALALASLTTPGFAADEGSTAVAELGQLNGIALACKQPALVSRARNAVVSTAPKTREHGEIFENVTTTA